MRKFATASEVSFPSKLTGTTLRKYVATTSVSLNLSENEVMELADFMGHGDKIHRVHYRQRDVAREITKITKILEAAQESPDGENGTDSDSDGEPGNLDFVTAMKVLDKEKDHPRTCNASKKARSSTCKESAPNRVNNDVDTEESDSTPERPSKKIKKRCRL